MLGCTALAQTTYSPDQILVRTKNGVIPPLARVALGAEEVRLMPELGISMLKIKGMSVDEGIALLKRSNNVLYASRDNRVELFHTPNDPLYSQQYGHPQVKDDVAWDLFKGNNKMVVAILDTGLRLTHQDIAGRIAPGGYDYSDNDSDPSDYQGHGSHCAGIAAANTNNSLGVASSAYNAKVLPLKVFPNSFASTVILGIKGAADKGAKIISMSLGFGIYDQGMQDACNYAWGKGCLIFASAGNAGNTAKNYPAALDNVIAVAATNNTDNRAGFSTYGDWVHVAAPGEDILSFGMNSDSEYVLNSGTSMACPFAASIAALVWGRNPALTNAQVRDILFTTADAKNFVTKGRLNAAKAVAKAQPLLAYTSTTLLSQLGVVGSTTEGTNVTNFGSIGAAAAATNATDAGRYIVRSIFQPKVGGTASLETIVRVMTPLTQIKSAKVELVSTAPVPVSSFVFAFNYSTGKFDQIGAASNTGAERTATVNFDPLTFGQYVNSSGHVRILVRSISPTRAGQNAWNIEFNRIAVTGGYDPTVSP